MAGQVGESFGYRLLQQWSSCDLLWPSYSLRYERWSIIGSLRYVFVSRHMHVATMTAAWWRQSSIIYYFWGSWHHQTYGRHGTELAWFTDYLAGRKQRVPLSSGTSERTYYTFHCLCMSIGHYTAVLYLIDRSVLLKHPWCRIMVYLPTSCAGSIVLQVAETSRNISCRQMFMDEISAWSDNSCS